MNALGILVRFRLRRDRVVGTAWVLVVALTVLFVVAALQKSYGTEQLRHAVELVVVGNPTLLAMRGAPDGTSAGAFFMSEIGAYLALLVAFMNTFTAVRHTRADEEACRTELVIATRAGRASLTWSVVVHAVILDLAMGILVALAATASGYDGGGSVVLGWSLASMGIAFFGIGLVSAQIFSTSRAANGFASAAIGVLWVLNAAAASAGTIDQAALRVTPSGLVWFTPVGWAMQVRPYTANQWAIGLLGLALGAVLIAAAFWLRSNRDTASGLVAPRAGRDTAAWSLRGPMGLAWRLQRGSIIGWGIGAVVVALLVAGLGTSLQKAITSTPAIAQVMAKLGHGGTVFETFLGMMIALVGLLVAGAAIQTMIRMRQEEALATAEAVLAAPVSRVRWFLCSVVLALVSSLVILAVAGAVMGAALAGIDSSLLGTAFALSLAQLPAVAVYLAIAAVVFGLVPRATSPVGWAVFGLGVLLGEFGALFGLPDWMNRLAPTAHTATVPLAHADWSGSWVMAAIAVALIAIGALAWRRRDVTGA